MGQAPSHPQAGVDFRVIGAGLPRTGTASLSAALEILLKGPVYHGGTQVALSPEWVIKSWIACFGHTAIKTPEDKDFVLSTLRSNFTGFTGTTDMPGQVFVKECLELWPNAKVIVTIRDKERWVESLTKVAKQSRMGMLQLILMPVPTMRWYVSYINSFNAGRWGELYYTDGIREGDWGRLWDRHMEWIKETVPKNKLLYYDLRDGWEPLCRFLEVEIPKDVEFPRINDGKAMEEFGARQVQRGLKAWGAILATTVVICAIAWTLWPEQ